MSHHDKFWEKFGSKARQHIPEAYSPADWAAMEQLLDGTPPLAPAKKGNTARLMALLLLLIALAYLITGDFFEHLGSYDLIAEQTFFCALDPALRERYVEHMHRLLAPGGKLVGVLFDDPLNDDHPPFGGNKDEYLRLFRPVFEEVLLERCHNSVPPRAGRELWLKAVKR